MILKSKIFVFSTIFLVASTFSAHAMWQKDEDPFADLRGNTKILPSDTTPTYSVEERIRVETFCQHYNFADWFTNDIYEMVKGKSSTFNEYGVPNLYYDAACLFYNKRRVPGEFSLLYDLFTQIPFNKREAAFEWLNACAAYGTGPTLAEFYIVKGKEDDSEVARDQIEGVVSLEQHLFSLPHICPLKFEWRMHGHHTTSKDGTIVFPTENPLKLKY